MRKILMLFIIFALIFTSAVGCKQRDDVNCYNINIDTVEGLWNIVNWWDAIVLDCLWFCHCKKVIIPGTEGMKEYKDYLFHIKGSLKGMLYGIPASLLVGILVVIF